MSRKRFSGWEWNERTQGWLEKTSGTQTQVGQWLDARSESLAKNKDTEAVYCMMPTWWSGPKFAPALLQGERNPEFRMVQYIPEEEPEPEAVQEHPADPEYDEYLADRVRAVVGVHTRLGDLVDLATRLGAALRDIEGGDAADVDMGSDDAADAQHELAVATRALRNAHRIVTAHHDTVQALFATPEGVSTP